MLGLAAGLAAVLAPFSCDWPDGLERVLRDHATAVAEGGEWAAPFAGYSLPLTISEGLATAGAGLVGVVAAFVAAAGIACALGLGSPPRDPRRKRS
ncbi:MAG: hypothetical protein AB1609_11680 [Bacillota bacterium]